MVDCPTCSDEFDSVHGMRIHHVQAHKESIADDYTTCENCGDDFQVQRDKVEERRFCSKECSGDWRSEQLQGEDHHNFKRSSTQCDNCGEKIVRRPSEISDNGWNFCGNKCKYEHFSKVYSERRVGEGNPQWEGKHSTDEVNVTCDNCDTTFIVTRYEFQRTESNFCSHDCYGESLEGTWSGEDNPRWRGGYEPYYGPNWRKQRRATIERDDCECQDCGLTREAHYEKYEEDLHVHHIQPFRTFDDAVDANQLDNLTTLCKQCHAEREAETVAA